MGTSNGNVSDRECRTSASDKLQAGADSGVVAGGPHKLGLSENGRKVFYVSENFVQKVQKLALKNPIWGNLGGKLKFSAPIISSVGHLHRSVGKLQLPAPPTLFSPLRRRGPTF